MKPVILRFMLSPDEKGLLLTSETEDRSNFPDLGYPIGMPFPASIRAASIDGDIDFAVENKNDHIVAHHPKFGELKFSLHEDGRLPYVGQAPLLQGAIIQTIMGSGKELEALCQAHRIYFVGEDKPFAQVESKKQSWITKT